MLISQYINFNKAMQNPTPNDSADKVNDPSSSLLEIESGPRPLEEHKDSNMVLADCNLSFIDSIYEDKDKYDDDEKLYTSFSCRDLLSDIENQEEHSSNELVDRNRLSTISEKSSYTNQLEEDKTSETMLTNLVQEQSNNARRDQTNEQIKSGESLLDNESSLIYPISFWQFCGLVVACGAVYDIYWNNCQAYSFISGNLLAGLDTIDPKCLL